jgi:tungstate transport system permease protein
VGFIAESLQTALSLIFSADKDVFAAVRTSVGVASWSVLWAALFGMPVGIGVGVGQFPLKRVVLVVLNSLMATPTE